MSSNIGETDCHRLDAAVPVIEEILRNSRCPSFSVGVLHHGSTILTKGFGFSKKEENRLPDENTIYHIGSCTKAFTATAIALLAEQGKVDLFAPISRYLPAFRTTYNPEVSQKATIVDVLTHSTGLAPLIYGVLGRNHSILTRHEDVVHTCSRLPCVARLGSEWQYNNWSYALASRLVDKYNPLHWADAVSDVLHNLGLSRTLTSPIQDDNIAKAYTVLSDGSYTECTQPQLQGGDAFDGSGAMRSCVKDLLQWSKALMVAHRLPAPIVEQDSEVVLPTLPESLELSRRQLMAKALRIIQEPQFTLVSDPLQSYALGLFTLSMPTTALNTVSNPPEVMASYILGEESPPRVVVGHTGDLGSFTSAYWTFPETESAVVVLTNGSSVDGDLSNIVAQVLTQALFDLKPKIDLVGIAGKAMAASKKAWEDTRSSWWAHRQLGTHHKCSSAYMGSYTSTDLRMTLRVDFAPSENKESQQDLEITINDLPDQRLRLHHYHHDTWSFFPATRDDCLMKDLGIYMTSWRAFNFDFTRFEVDKFGGMQWSMDLDPRAGPQVFGRIGP